MNKTVIKDFVAFAKALATKNTLSDDAREAWRRMSEAVEALEADSNEHDVTSLNDKLAQIQAEVAKKNEDVANAIAGLRSRIEEVSKVRNSADIKSKFTTKVKDAICGYLLNARNMAPADIEAGVMKIAAENEITGLSFPAIMDYTIELKQEDNDPIYEELAKVPYTAFFAMEIDESEAAMIAKQWNGLGQDVTAKDIQQLAAEVKQITTKELYKRQRMPNSVLDDIEEAGAAAEFESTLFNEENKAVQGLAVRAIIVGDTVNPDGKKVTSFETIGTKTVNDLYTTVLETATTTASIVDFRTAAEAVKSDYKVAVISGATKIALATRLYAAGGTPIMLSDEELAGQIGVNKVYTRDFIENGDSTRLAVIFDPRRYAVKIKKERQMSYPVWSENTLNFQVEKNIGGAIRGAQSSAVLRLKQ